jgi:hypothetical protein
MAAVLDFAFLLFLIFLGVAVAVVMATAIWRLVSTAGPSSRSDVALDYEVAWKAGTTLDYLEEHVSPVMEEAGYSTERDASELRSWSTHIRIWSILLIILFFPISLLLLLAVKLSSLASGNDGALLSRRDSLTIKVSPLGSGSLVTVIGRVGRGARDQLTQLLAGIGEQRTPAGWYEEAAGIERYWDGEKWAQQTRRTTDLPIVVGPRMQHAQTKARQPNQ